MLSTRIKTILNSAKKINCEKIQVKVGDVSLFKSLINSLRRISISEVSTIAFKTEPIIENDIIIIENKILKNHTR